MLKRILSASVLAITATLPVAAQDRTGITADTIKIGIAGPFSGNASELSKAQLGSDAYYKSINDAGGVHGRKIETVIEDDACEEARGIAATRKLIHQDKVFALHAHSCSGVALASKPIIIESKIPYMVGSAVSENISRPFQPNIFHPTPPSEPAGAAMLKFALSKPGAKRIAVVAHTNEWAKGYHDAVIAGAKEKGGEVELINLTMERQSMDATAQVLRIRQEKPDFIIAILYSTETTIFLRDAAKFGLNIPIIGGYSSSIEDQLKRTGNPEAVKNFFTVYLLKHVADAPEMKPWRDMITKYYPKETVSSLHFVALGGAVAIVEALRTAGPDVSRESFIAELDKQKGLDTKIMAGAITFTPTNHVGITDLAVAGFVDGKPTIFSAWNQQVR